MKNILNKFTLVSVMIFLSVYILNAQRAQGDFGIGFQFGEPNGISAKIYNEPTSIDLLVAWKNNVYTMVNGHLVFDKHLTSDHNFHFLYGPGALVWIYSGNEGSSTDFGISGLIGFDYIIDNFEIFVQGIPRINLSQSSDIDVGGGLGLRYYF